jgi:HEAT repeat protein
MIHSIPFSRPHLLSLSVMLCLTLSFGHTAEAKEKKYYGKTIQEWGKQLSDKDPQKRKNAAELLGNLPNLPKSAAPILKKALSSRDETVRFYACTGLGKLGEAAKSAIPGLLKLIDADKADSSSDAGAAVKALSKLGKTLPAVSDAVLKRLKSTKKDGTKDNAFKILGGLGADSEDAIAALLAGLSEKSYKVRGSAQEALSKLGTKVIPSLLQKLEKDGYSWTSDAFGILKKMEKEAIPSFVKLLEHKDPKAREAAVLLLSSNRRDPQTAVKALQKAFKDPVLTVRRTAVREIGAYGWQAKSAIPELLKLLEDKELDKKSVISLGNIGAEAEKVVPSLVKMLKKYQVDKSLEKRAEYCQLLVDALSKFERKAEAATPVIVRILTETDSPPYYILHALQRIGRGAKAALPALEKVAQNKSNSTLASLARRTITAIKKDMAKK